MGKEFSGKRHVRLLRIRQVLNLGKIFIPHLFPEAATAKPPLPCFPFREPNTDWGG